MACAADQADIDIWICQKGHCYDIKLTGKYCPIPNCGYELKPKRKLGSAGASVTADKKTKMVKRIVKRCPDKHNQPIVGGGRCSLCSKAAINVEIECLVEVREEAEEEDKIWYNKDQMIPLREPGDPPRNPLVFNPFRPQIQTFHATEWHSGPTTHAAAKVPAHNSRLSGKNLKDEHSPGQDKPKKPVSDGWLDRVAEKDKAKEGTL